METRTIIKGIRDKARGKSFYENMPVLWSTNRGLVLVQKVGE